MRFKDIAFATTEKGIPVIRLKPKSKIAIDGGWPELATTDPDVISKWDQENPEANCGAVAKAEPGGFWFLEIDNPSVPRRIEEETGQKIPLTYRVRSRPGRGHYYWLQTPESIALGNVGQGFVKNEDFSVRVSNEYVCASGCVHPISGTAYEVVCTAPIIEAPVWLIEWIKKQKVQKESTPLVDATTPIEEGKRNDSLMRIAAKQRNAGLTRDEIETSLSRINQERCTPPLPESEVKTIADSMSRYPVKEDPRVLLGGKPIDTLYNVPAEATPEIDTTALADRPVFPYWVLSGTTLGEGFVKPVLAASSKHAEFLYLPAVQLMVNSLFGKVRMKHQTVNLNMFVGLVSPYGKFFKSTSCKLAHDYFKEAGLCTVYTPRVQNADAKIVITGAGSPEGFGKLMSGLNCRNAILYNDELGKFVAKAGIESSSFSSDLLSFHGSADFNNTVKSAKDSFAFEGGTYCFSWLWCTTDRGFNRHWPKLAGISSGLEDRMFFVLGPEKPKENAEYQDPWLAAGAKETREAIDAAVRQGVFDYESRPAVQEALKDLDPRSMQLVQILALYFAVDLKETEISNEAVSRAKALVEYRNAVAAYLAPIEALNEQARLQKEIRRELQRNRGVMKSRDLCRALHYEDYGMDVWSKAIGGLIKYEEVVEFTKTSPSGQKMKMIGLAKLDYD